MATGVAQLVNWIGWLILRPGGDYIDWVKANAAFENPWGMLSAHLALATLIPISLALVLFVHRRLPGFLASVRPWFRWRYLGLSMGWRWWCSTSSCSCSTWASRSRVLQPQQNFWVLLVVILAHLAVAGRGRGVLLPRLSAAVVPHPGAAQSLVRRGVFGGVVRAVSRHPEHSAVSRPVLRSVCWSASWW